MKKVVVLLPTYNEKENIAKFSDEVLEQEKNLPGYRIEILIVDSHSPDGSGEIAKRLSEKNDGIHYLEVGPGLGVATIKGHQYSLKNLKPDILAQMDADGQVGADVLPRLIKGIEEGYDLVLGSRFVRGGKNLLTPSRKLFSNGSSIWCRIVMGPLSIGEFTNSARAFTLELFKKINIERIPWREKTFIIQPAFLHEALEAKAKYKEVPLIFKNRAEGYSKMKTFNYIYDVVSYTLEIRMRKMGLNIPIFHASRRAKTLIKFGLVGFIGTLVDFLFYNIFIAFFGLPPASSKGISTSIAILNNFTLNNSWTFKHRKTNNALWKRFVMFYIFSFGGLAIGVLMVKFLHGIYGDGFANVFGLRVPFYNLYFFATIPFVMSWNFIINHFVTWKKVEINQKIPNLQ